ncbi:hypothetical protein [Paenibacillus caui]|uniref:hypothetical protein n=1 Tax=Paenibacillus caui TaxID=2873927 RepID=UPI001CAA236C|nr:hypothetical protein [Paenibacillus caui]
MNLTTDSLILKTKITLPVLKEHLAPRDRLTDSIKPGGKRETAQGSRSSPAAGAAKAPDSKGAAAHKHCRDLDSSSRA